MKIRYAKNLTVLLVFTLLLSVFSPSVFAEEAPGFELPVTVSLSGTPPTTNNEYIIILEAENIDYPMPEESVDGKYQLSMEENSTSKFPEMNFTSLGVYTYKIYQSSDTDKSYGYDDRVYSLVVYVTNAEDGSGLENTVILYLTGQTEKLDQVIFQPEVPQDPVGPEKPEVPQTPEDPDIPKATAEVDQPKTGDDTDFMFYLLLLASGIALLLVYARTKKKKEIED